MKYLRLLIPLGLSLIALAATAAPVSHRTPRGTGPAPAAAPALVLNSVPAFGTFGGVSGTASGFAPGDRVATYIFIPSVGWWTKPTFANPTAELDENGRFSAWVTSGGLDHRASRITCFLIGAGYNPPAAAGVGTIPPDIEANAKARVDVYRTDPETVTVEFAGYTWEVKSSAGWRVGPDGNVFNPENVWVTSDGSLHLRVTGAEGNSSAAELIGPTLGYGKYAWVVDSPLSALTDRMVLGMFTWSDAGAGSPVADSHSEIDLEHSATLADPFTSQFVLQPYYNPGNQLRYSVPRDAHPFVNYFNWTPGSVVFQTHLGSRIDPARNEDVIAREVIADEARVPRTDDERVRLNAWMVGGQAPEDGKDHEITIRNFIFVPASGDRTAPTISRAGATSAAVPSRGSGVTIEADVADSAGVRDAWAEIDRPDGAMQRVVMERVSGGATSGKWRGAFLAPGNSGAQGSDYSVMVWTRDQSQNHAHVQGGKIHVSGQLLPPSFPSASSPRDALRVNLSFYDQSEDEAGYIIQRKVGDGSFAELARRPAANGVTFYYSDAAVQPGTRYTYQMKAYNAGDESVWSDPVQATTLALPTPPANLTATIRSGTRVDLTWEDRSDNESGFRIERKQEAGGYSPVHTAPAGAETYSDTSVTPGISYTYRVRAINAAGASAPSSEVGAVTPTRDTGHLQVVERLDFGTVRTRKRVLRWITLRNISTTARLRVKVSQAPSPFRVVKGTGTRTIPPGRRYGVQVRFRPSRPGAFNRSLTVESSDREHALVQVVFSGTGR